jgi:hypothetical protein
MRRHPSSLNPSRSISIAGRRSSPTACCLMDAT